MTVTLKRAWRCASVLAAAALAGLTLAVTTPPLRAQAPSSAAAKAYDAAVKARVPPPEVTFGHDVNVEEKAWDFAKTFAAKVKLSDEVLNKAKDRILALTEEAMKLNEPMNPDELNAKVAKGLLDNASPKDVVRVMRLLGLSKEATKLFIEHGTDLIEGGAEAAGQAWEADSDALETALLSGVDTFCPECAIARKGALLAIEAGKAVEAWAEDETTQIQFTVWKNTGTPLTAAGFGPTMSAARRALTSLYEDMGRKPPTTDEVERFVLAQFEKWKRLESDAESTRHLLEEVKDDYLRLSDYDRMQFGDREADRAARFADYFTEAYRTLREAQGNRPFPPGGRERLLQDAVMLASARASYGNAGYRDRMYLALVGYGWKPAISAARTTAVKNRLAQRLPNLTYENLEAFFDYAQLEGTKDFYGCLCGRLPGVGIGKQYSPGAGGPCHLFGYGDWHEGFPSDPQAWGICLAETKVGTRSFADAAADRIITWTAMK
jgi:hypothetical protein